MATDVVGNISGTAFWVAHYRALESRRRVPLFDDPWAERLAGERGAQVARQLARADYVDWVIAVRTAILDRLILAAVARGSDLVVNLAAGLDVRPFRLDLPAELRWFDIDKPEVLDYKRSMLKDARPHCDMQWLALDLSDSARRGTTLRDLAAE